MKTFTEARRALIESLRAGDYRFELRMVVEAKNLLATGDVTPGELIAVLNRCRGNQHRTSPHHAHRETLVHIFEPTTAAEAWYIKAYFVALGDGHATVIISVHKQERPPALQTRR